MSMKIYSSQWEGQIIRSYKEKVAGRSMRQMAVLGEVSDRPLPRRRTSAFGGLVHR